MPIHSFSLSWEATKVMARIPKGKKSSFVNNAIGYWIKNRELWNSKYTRSMLLDTDISTLQNIAWAHYERIQELEAELLASKALNESNTPPSKGKKSLNILTHALNLLKHRLLRR
jgi:hypothetical protein